MGLSLEGLVLKLGLIDGFFAKVEGIGFFLQEVVSSDAINAHVVLDSFFTMIFILFLMKISFVDGHASGGGHFEFGFSCSSHLIHSDYLTSYLLLF